MNKTTNKPNNFDNFFQSLPMDIFNRNDNNNWLISSTPKSRLVTITPQLGEELISRNIGNRNLSLGEVSKLREEIRRGNFVTTGQGLSVNTQGILVDGQHRLYALKAEGWPNVKMFVMTGIADEAKMYFDQHRIRREKDIFDIEHPSAKVKSRFFSVLNYIIQYNNKWNRAGRTKLVNSEKKEMIPIYKNEIDNVVDIGSPKAFFASPHYAGFVVVAHETGRLSEVCDFVKQVADGINLTDRMPAYHLRNFVSMQRGGSGSNIHQERMMKSIAATRAFLDKKEMKLLRASYSI
jgi:hypothetical protein